MEKHLGGVIHVVDKCREEEEEARQISLPTFRPNLIRHLSDKTQIENEFSSKNRQKASTQKRPKSENANRRMDTDYEEYDENASQSDMTDATSQLVARCKERLSEKGSRKRTIRRRQRRDSDAKIDGMPVFEHFPVRDPNDPSPPQQQQQQQPLQLPRLPENKMKLKKKGNSPKSEPETVDRPEMSASQDFLEEEQCRNLEGLLLSKNLENFESSKFEEIVTLPPVKELRYIHRYLKEVECS